MHAETPILDPSFSPEVNHRQAAVGRPIIPCQMPHPHGRTGRQTGNWPRATRNVDESPSRVSREEGQAGQCKAPIVAFWKMSRAVNTSRSHIAGQNVFRLAKERGRGGVQLEAKPPYRDVADTF
jgi:hypothetical protein